MHTIQLHTIPLRKVCKKPPATLPTAIAAAFSGAEFRPAATIRFASTREPIRLPAYDRLQFFKRSLFHIDILFEL